MNQNFDDLTAGWASNVEPTVSSSSSTSSSNNKKNIPGRRHVSSSQVNNNDDELNDDDNPDSPSSSSSQAPPASSSRSALVMRLLLGQIIALCVALNGLFSTLLAEKKSSIALLQSCTAYALTFICCAPIHYRNSKHDYAVEKYVEQQVAARQERNQQQQQQQNHQGGETADSMNLVNENSNNNNNNNQDSSSTEKSKASIWQVGIPGYFQSHAPLWRYCALACTDVGAMFFAIKAYSFTDITSAQVLDAATIFTVMLLGYLFLHRKFNLRHFLGIAFAFAGMIGLVFLDSKGASTNNDADAPDPILGDTLCLIASALAGITNIGCESLLKAGRVGLPKCCKKCCKKKKTTQEISKEEDEDGLVRTVVVTNNQNNNNNSTGLDQMEVETPQQQKKNNRDDAGSDDSSDEEEEEENEEDEGTPEKVREAFNLIIEYSTFISFFGFFISLVLVFPVSLGEIQHVAAHWDWETTMFQLAFCCVMVGNYVGLPSLLKLTNATFAALSLLTADAYAVILNYVTTGVAPVGMYYLCAGSILLGVLVFDTAEVSTATLKKQCTSCC